MPVRLLLGILAAIFLAIFSAVWLGIAWDLWHFHVTPEHAKLDFSKPAAIAAGFIATAAGAGTATVLGIQVQKIKTTGKGIFASIKQATSPTLSPLVFVGILVYAIVGGTNLFVWWKKSDVSPDMVEAFAFGVLGWFAGAFSSVFAASA